MCGIWFSAGFSTNTACIDIVKHRGPDGRGWNTFDSAIGPIAMGHRRLAIIDLEGAHQPMSCNEERYWITFNGEIYNFPELREELQAKGHYFHTLSDTEVLLNAFLEWKETCLERLMGMFSFVIYDMKEEKVFAARDRFGIKPLYYCQTELGFAFASEIKQLLECDGVEKKVNKARVYDYLSVGLLNHTCETLFDGIFQIRAGQAVSLDLKCKAGSAINSRVYNWYTLPIPGSLNLHLADASSEFQKIFKSSIDMHMRSDVEVGSCLSGGLDSSAIVSLAASLKADTGTFKTFSACFNEKRVDERPYIKSVVDATKVHAYYTYPEPDELFNTVKKITWHQDEPFGSSSIFAQWAVFEDAARHGVKVMLDGQGADEQLAGYHHCFHYYIHELLASGHFWSALETVFERWYKTGLSPFKQLPIKRFLYRFFRNKKPSPSITKGLRKAYFLPSDPYYSPLDFALKVNEITNATTLSGACLAMIKANSLGMLLHWEDRNSMAHSIESRVPFLDHRLVELNIALGSKHKFKGARTKVILREALKDFLPRKIYRRLDKLGFATPEKEWLQGYGKERVMIGLEQTVSRFPDMFHREELESYVLDALNDKKSLDFTLWRLINLGVWGEVFDVKQ